MKAIRIHEPTGISRLVYEEAPDATPMIGDVLVKVDACGITHNELDWPLWTRRNGHQRASIIPGHEVSGVVTALGPGTAGIAVGDEVFGLTDQYRDAAAAEYIAVEARNLAPKPQTADHVHAAAVPRAGLTAWQALFDHGKLAKGQTVIIHGAGGAVGSTAVQLARWAGAEVIGTGRSHSRPLVLELGADRFVALDEERLEDAAGSGFQADLVFDAAGGEILAQSASVVKPGGALISVAAFPPFGREDAPPVLILDEPTTGVDPEQRVTLRAVLAEIARTSVVVLSTHQTEDVAALCERVIVLEGGRVRYDGPVTDLVRQAAGRVWLADEPDPAASVSWRTGTGRYRNVGTRVRDGAEHVEPSLEDAYLLLRGGAPEHEAAGEEVAS